MGPHSDERGKEGDPYFAYAEVEASMGPHSDERGKECIGGVTLVPPLASMGPHSDERGKGASFNSIRGKYFAGAFRKDHERQRLLAHHRGARTSNNEHGGSRTVGLAETLEAALQGILCSSQVQNHDLVLDLVKCRSKLTT